MHINGVKTVCMILCFLISAKGAVPAAVCGISLAIQSSETIVAVTAVRLVYDCLVGTGLPVLINKVCHALSPQC